MKARNVMLCAGLPLCMAAGLATAQQQLQTLGMATITQQESYRIAPLTYENGQWILGEFGPWTIVGSETVGRTLNTTPAIDAYEFDYAAATPNTPIGADACTTDFGPSTRYFFGATVYAPHYANDFELTRPETRGRIIGIAGHTLFWNPPVAEPCFIIFRFWDDFNAAGNGTINPTTTGFNPGPAPLDANLAARRGLGGFAVQHRSGTSQNLDPVPAGYRTRWYNFKNLPSIQVYLPTDGTGATEMIITRSVNGWTGGTASNQPGPGVNTSAPLPGPLTYVPATGPTQSMLWSMDNNDPFPSTPARPGRENNCVMWVNLDDLPASTNGNFVWNAPTTGLRNDFFGLGCGTTAWAPCARVGGLMYHVIADTATPAAPCSTNTAPANGATGVDPASVNLTSTASAGATRYIFEVSTNANGYPVVARVTSNTPSATVTGLAASTQYFWSVTTETTGVARVAACNGTFSFTTGTGGSTCPGQGSGACGPGDWNEDGVIDFNDLLAFLNDYNAQTECSDVNADGTVDFNDLLEFLNRYNANC